MAPKQRHLPQLLDRQQTRPQTIVDVVIAVGDLVSAIGELRLQRGLPVRQKAFGDVAKLRGARFRTMRSEEHTSELQSLMRISYAVFCLKKKKKQTLKRIER